MIDSVSDQEVIAAFKELLSSSQLGVPDLLQITKVADRICAVRYERARQLGMLDAAGSITSHVKSDSIDDQSARLGKWPIKRRATLLIDAIFSIPKYHYRASNLKVLIIGPRNEVEILHLMSHGVNKRSIIGLDLISYSPHVMVGDAHNLPFPNDSFDVVVSGWVLPYSHNYWPMVGEMIRVSNPNGVCAVGFNSEYYTVPGDVMVEQTHEPLMTADSILQKIAPWVSQVYHCADPEFPFSQLAQRVHLVFGVKKRPIVLSLSDPVEKVVAAHADTPVSEKHTVLQIRRMLQSEYGYIRYGAPRSEIRDVKVIGWWGREIISQLVAETVNIEALYSVLSSQIPHLAQEIYGAPPVLAWIRLEDTEKKAGEEFTENIPPLDFFLGDEAQKIGDILELKLFKSDAVVRTFWSISRTPGHCLSVLGVPVSLDLVNNPRLFSNVAWSH